MNGFAYTAGDNFPATGGLRSGWWPQLAIPLRSLDGLLVLAAALLLSLGLVMVFSASVTVHSELASGELVSVPFKHVLRQGVFLFMGLCAGFVVLCLPLQVLHQYSSLLLLISVLLLALVLTPVGKSINGSQRWIPLGVMNFQVAEMVKLVMLIFTASFIDRAGKRLIEQWHYFLRPVLVLAMVVLLILCQTDLGTSVVIAVTVMTMLFLAGVKLWCFLAVATPGLLLFAGVAYFSPERLSRLKAYLNPWEDLYDTGYQLTRSLIAIGRGEWFGVGLGNSLQKHAYLPEAHTDFIFSIFAEEFGLVGVTLLLLLFSLLVGRILFIARKAARQNHVFGAYCCLGVAVMMAFQSFVNVSVASGLLPTKGLTLPFISYGGSSLIVCCVMLALVLRVNWEVEQQPKAAWQASHG